MTKELRRCPFCGGEAKWYETESSKYPYQIVCTQCYCGTDEMTYKEDAIDRWNRRDTEDRIVEQLEELADEANDKWCAYDQADDYYDGREDGFREAIEIVKGGSV